MPVSAGLRKLLVAVSSVIAVEVRVIGHEPREDPLFQEGHDANNWTKTKKPSKSSIWSNNNPNTVGWLRISGRRCDIRDTQMMYELETQIHRHYYVV